MKRTLFQRTLFQRTFFKRTLFLAHAFLETSNIVNLEGRLVLRSTDFSLSSGSSYVGFPEDFKQHLRSRLNGCTKERERADSGNGRIL